MRQIVVILFVILCLATFQAYSIKPTLTDYKGRPKIEKLGTIDCDLVETTPVVFKGKVYRFEKDADSPSL